MLITMLLGAAQTRPSPGRQGKERGSFLADKDNPCRFVKGCPAFGQRTAP